MAEVGWGVLGCADIARKACTSILEASNARVVAVASRSQEKAEAFATANAPGARAYGCYEELLADAAVQAVYIPLPTALRPEWVIKAAESKKHVLCEKPLAGTYQVAQQLVEACDKAGVQFMDDTMFMHNDRLQEMRKVLDDRTRFGTPKCVTSTFTIPFGNDENWATSNIRMSRDTEPLGCLGDLGWYCVMISLWAFDYDIPELVRCDYIETVDGTVPVHLVAVMKFSMGRIATFDCSFKHSLRQWVEVVSEKATLRLDDFVVAKKVGPASYSVMRAGIADKALTFPQDTTAEHVEARVQHACLIENFSRLVAEGKRDAFWPRVSLQAQRVVAALDTSALKQGEWVAP